MLLLTAQKQHSDYNSKKSEISGPHNLSENESSLGVKFWMLVFIAKVSSVCVCEENLIKFSLTNFWVIGAWKKRCFLPFERNSGYLFQCMNISISSLILKCQTCHRTWFMGRTNAFDLFEEIWFGNSQVISCWD